MKWLSPLLRLARLAYRCFRAFDRALDVVMPVNSQIEGAFWMTALLIAIYYTTRPAVPWLVRIPAFLAIWTLMARLMFRVADLDRMQYRNVVAEAYRMYRHRRRRSRLKGKPDAESVAVVSDDGAHEQGVNATPDDDPIAGMY